jgi:hypothetical protein
LIRSALAGSIGFCFASFIVFGTVAFAESWMYEHLTVTGAYLCWTILFVVVGSLVLGKLVVHENYQKRFYVLFALSFLAYSIGWICSYFILKGTFGEWAGSLAGSILMALVFSIGFSVTPSLLLFSLILFAANSVGYFLGAAINNAVQGKAGMLLWGSIYGLFLGAGLGIVLHLAQSSDPKKSC